MAEKLNGFFELKVTLGNILSVLVLLAAGYAGYVELRTNHTNLDREFREHQNYDDRRFADYATKEARVQRDKMVDEKLQDILERVKRIEAAHMR